MRVERERARKSRVKLRGIGDVGGRGSGRRALNLRISDVQVFVLLSRIMSALECPRVLWKQFFEEYGEVKDVFFPNSAKINTRRNSRLAFF